ncbi:uncharacterized protein LOC129242480 [Anastrepha obliqua]|uniref:uncharacterized protein LOC129242480 n=1 Tax=Anastrepha obliqua TaxID=95512 RepID=UPI00240A41C4|nr:uncharacterized protein LOC129242480 [Anastrepha obliqua]
MKILFVLLLCVVTALAATHVNISIAQQPATNPADVTYLEGTAPEELKAGPAKKTNVDERIARLRVAEESDNNGNVQMSSEQKQEVSSFDNNSKPAQQIQQNAEPSKQQQRFYGRIRQSNRQSQFRQANAQEKQNQEFERYIQNYHSGPTVETVFETADHSPSARYEYSSSSSSSSSPARIIAAGAQPEQQQHTFERQVALPAAVTSSSSAPVEEHSKSAPDAKIQISPATVAAPAAVPTPVAVHASSPAVSHPSSSVVPSLSSKTDTAVISGGSDGGKLGVGGSFGASFAGAGSGGHGVTYRVAGGGSYDQPNFDIGTSYSKPDYDQPSYNYGHADAGGFLNQYPPSVDEPAGGYDGFYGSQEHEYHPNGGYLPSPPIYQRPMVTKTIQIAQPALKAKKFEVRHPAIQKEFYDIEERVVIKPAGTIVVELEHPVAKIPRGETVLPLGHPHPAIAAQYNLNSDADIETESSSAGSYNNGVRSSSNQVYASPSRKQSAPVVGSTHIGSTVTSTPTNNQNAKRDFVEANLRKQYGEEAQHLATTDNALREQKPRAKDLYIPADTHGNQRQTPNRSFSPNSFRREESIYQRPARVEVKNKDETYRSAFSKNEEQSLNNNAPEFDDDDYKGEYITGNFYSSVNKDLKPARLQEEPRKSERITAEPRMQIIKHEHTINIPPSQHNIYLAPSRFQERPLLVQEQRKQAPSPKQQPVRLEEETAQVREVKPFLDQQRDGVVVYAVPVRRPVATQQRYIQNERRQPQSVSQQRSYSQLRYDPDADVDASVEYSAPYSHMRFDPKESARLTADVEFNQKTKGNVPERTVTIHYNRGPESNARLVAQNKSESDEKESPKVVALKEDVRSELRPLAHIQLRVPNGPQEADEPIRVMSSIHPPREQSRTTYSRQTAAKQTVDDQVEQVNAEPAAIQSDNQEQDVLRSENVVIQPDCVQATEKVSARYESNPQNEDNSQYAEEQRDREPVKSLRLIDTSNSNANGQENVKPESSNIQAENVDTNVKEATQPGSRVIAANPAPNDASATSETFHKRRIVVNHPFQTVREVVEHEPITNYHQIQVHEPASPASAYNKAPYFAPNGALRVPVMYHHASGASHGNLVYALPDAIPVHEDTAEVEPTYQQKRQRARA